MILSNERYLRRVCLPVLALLGGLINAANADVIAEYLFWDAMGKNAAQGVKSYIEYRQQRQLWAQKIAEGKAALARCGNCSERAETEKELAYWQKTENQFQQIAGAAAASVGMPPVIAKWLDIDMPMAPPPSREEMEQRYRVVKPAWFESRPARCQQAVNAHLQCLREFQTRTGTPMTSVANHPGGACYDTGKLYDHCRTENYQAFDMEKNLQAARAGGAIIPEYVDAGRFLEVYYGPVPDNFVPSLPPDVVREKFSEGGGSGVIRLTTRKKGTGVLGTVSIQRFFWNRVVPSSNCFSGGERRSEIERRVCDDLSTLSFKDRPPLLLCQYTEGAGLMPSDAFSGSRFWFGSRPAAAEPERLLSRSSDHPVLAIGEARTACPATKREAERIEADWVAKLGGLRANTPQIAETTILPEAEWRQEQREANKARGEAIQQQRRATENFPFEGVYSFETTFEGATTSGQCVMSYAGPVRHAYLLQCRHPGGAATGKARLYTGSLAIDWQLGGKRFNLQYQIDDADPNALAGVGARAQAGSGRLVRTGDLAPLAKFPVTGVYRFERSGGGATQSGQCTVTTNDRLRPPPFHFACVSDSGESFSNTAQNDESAIFVSLPPFNGVSMGGLVLVASERADGAAGLSFVGANEYGARVRLVRTGGLPASSREAAQAAPAAAARTSAGAGRARQAAPGRRPVAPAASAQPSRGAPRAPGQPCTAADVAGTYVVQSGPGYGPLVCKAAGSRLDCCYGRQCENSVKLALDAPGQNATGTWMRPNGSQGPAIFPVSADCALGSGRWNGAGRQPSLGWVLRGRAPR